MLSVIGFRLIYREISIASRDKSVNLKISSKLCKSTHIRQKLGVNRLSGHQPFCLLATNDIIVLMFPNPTSHVRSDLISYIYTVRRISRFVLNKRQYSET